MATAQLCHVTRTHKASKETVFPSDIANEHESLIMVKKLFATSISCITYLRGLFPESSYGNRHLDDLSLKILREDKKCPGSVHIIKWIQGCFDALEKRYLYMAILTLYTNPKEPEKVTEIYQFKFKYTKEGTSMDFASNSTSFESGTNGEDTKKACTLLIRQLYLLMQNLGPLPNDVILTMKLHYYNSVTPHDYQPPGFKEGINTHFLLFDGEPVSLQMGSVSTDFHSMKVKVTTEASRVPDSENSFFQESSTTEIAHQGLDCDEEEECNNQLDALNSLERAKKLSQKLTASRGPQLLTLGMADSDTGSRVVCWAKQAHRKAGLDPLCNTERMNFVPIEPSFESSKKRRKVNEPVKVSLPKKK